MFPGFCTIIVVISIKKAQKVQADSGCKGIQGNTSKVQNLNATHFTRFLQCNYIYCFLHELYTFYNEVGCVSKRVSPVAYKRARFASSIRCVSVCIAPN